MSDVICISMILSLIAVELASIGGVLEKIYRLMKEREDE